MPSLKMSKVEKTQKKVKKTEKTEGKKKETKKTAVVEEEEKEQVVKEVGTKAERRVAANLRDEAAERLEENLEIASKYVSRDTVDKAVAALVKHDALRKKEIAEKKQKLDLLEGSDDDETVYDMRTENIVQVMFAVITPPVIKTSAKTYKVPITHKLVDLSKTAVDICLFVKDKKEAENWFAGKPIQGVKKIIDLQELRTSYHSFKHRRELLAQYDLFLGDSRIAILLPKALGKIFYGSPKSPIEVRISSKAGMDSNVHFRIQNAVENTHFRYAGPSSSVRAAKINWKESHIVDNVMECVADCVYRIPGGWDNIQTIVIKTGNSASLPIFRATPISQEEQEELKAVKEEMKKKRALEASKKENESIDEAEEEVNEKPAKKAKKADVALEGKKAKKPTSTNAVADTPSKKSKKADSEAKSASKKKQKKSTK